jgi:hypothetical protein
VRRLYAGIGEVNRRYKTKDDHIVQGNGQLATDHGQFLEPTSS